MITAQIKVDDNNQIEKIFEAEQKESTGERASYSLKKQGNKIIFEIKAKDFVSLRAILNSITKLLDVNYKINKI
jgi:tRNA threonylcarbamoyladenosine modification (KEOPS) complex  Pcc1 subunit